MNPFETKSTSPFTVYIFNRPEIVDGGGFAPLEIQEVEVVKPVWGKDGYLSASTRIQRPGQKPERIDATTPGWEIDEDTYLFPKILSFDRPSAEVAYTQACENVAAKMAGWERSRELFREMNEDRNRVVAEIVEKVGLKPLVEQLAPLPEGAGRFPSLSYAGPVPMFSLMITPREFAILALLWKGFRKQNNVIPINPFGNGDYYVLVLEDATVTGGPIFDETENSSVWEDNARKLLPVLKEILPLIA